MSFSRREFIGFSAAFAAGRAFAAPAGLFGAGTPNMRIGVISDIHVDAPKGDFMIFGDTTTFESTLRYFRSVGVDGVVIAGDMADCGMRNQLQCVADAWERVFPGGCGENGAKVEKLFVFGNHDMEGCKNWGFDKRYMHKPSFYREVIATDPKKAWEDIFHEPYAPIWTKVVKGYRFVGAHWKPKHPEGIAEIEPWFAEHAGEIDPGLPFFYIQHQHPKGTCHQANAWGADDGLATRVLSRFPNAVAFSGHSHIPLTDPVAIWQGAFTSVGCGSLRFAGGMFPLASGGERGHENTRDDSLMPKYEGVWESRQGMVLDVYDDRLVFERRDFMHGAEKVGDDWVVPLGKGAPQPYRPEANRLWNVAPEFAAGASIALSEGRTRPAAGGEPVPSLTLTVPAATGVAGARTYDWVLSCRRGGRKVFVRYVVDPNCRRAASRALGPTSIILPKAAFPSGVSTLSVAPRGYNGKVGNSIEVKVMI